MKVRIHKLLFFSLLLFFQCEVPFEENARLLIKGRVIDESNQPISDAEIKVFVRRGNDFLYDSEPSNDDGVFLGGSDSASDGTFSVITLLGKDDEFVIEVYADENYSKYMYRTDLEGFIPEDYLIDLAAITLSKTSLFQFNITRTSPIGTELEYSFEYVSVPCLEVYEQGVLNQEETYCYEPTNRSGFLNDNRPGTSGDFLSFLNSEVIFTYSINNQPEVTELLTINEEEFEFNFSY